jgi:hypothetical protein
VITYRENSYACPSCGIALVASTGDGPDGQPRKWWCTAENNAYDPREYELTPLTVTAPTESEDWGTAAEALVETNTAEIPSAIVQPVAESTPAVNLVEAGNDVASSISLEKVEPNSVTLPDPKADPAFFSLFMCRLALRRAQKVLLWGPPGTGKSSLAAMLELFGRKLVTIQMTPETPMFELRGRPIIKDGDVVWEHGPVNLAMLNGWRVLFDEIDQTGPDAMSYMYAALDDFGKLSRTGLTLPNGETIFPTRMYQPVCTMNGNPDRLLPAIKSRLSAASIEIKHPLPDVINIIAPDLRNAAINCVLDGKTSTREWINVTQLRTSLADEGLSEADCHKAAGFIVFGERWKEMIGDIAIGTAEEPDEASSNA